AFAINLGGIASAMSLHLQRRQLVAQLLDHVAANAVLAQLGFDEAPSPRSVSIALLDPPAREREVVDEAELGQVIERLRYDRVRCTRPPQPTLDLPAAPRPNAQEACSDLEGCLHPGRCSLAG